MSLNGLEQVSKSFFFLLMVRKKILYVFLFCEWERNSEHLYLPLNGSERNHEVPSVFLFNKMLRTEFRVFLSSTKCFEVIPRIFCLPRNGLERNYEVPRVFIFCEKAQNRITSVFNFRRMDWNRIPCVWGRAD